MEPNKERKIYRPGLEEESQEWIMSAPTQEGREFRKRVTYHNAVTMININRCAFAVEETDDGDRLIIDPPLTVEELRIMGKVPYFQKILQRL